VQIGDNRAAEWVRRSNPVALGLLFSGLAGQQLSPLSPSPQPSEFCNDENNSVIRSAMNTLRNSKKNKPPSYSHSLFITIFNLILDAPRTGKLHLKRKEYGTVRER
jgi:hypothetical protein